MDKIYWKSLGSIHFKYIFFYLIFILSYFKYTMIDTHPSPQHTHTHTGSHNLQIISCGQIERAKWIEK